MGKDCSSMSEIIMHGFEPHVTEAVIEHHDRYYRDHWDFDDRFEAQVRRELTTFTENLDPERDGFWWAEKEGAFAGAVAVDGDINCPDGARIRWFIVPEQFQGSGIGTVLFKVAMDFCREKEFPSVHLWTFKGLEAARTLYERNGFALTEEGNFDGWGPKLTEQKFQRDLSE